MISVCLKKPVNALWLKVFHPFFRIGLKLFCWAAEKVSYFSPSYYIPLTISSLLTISRFLPDEKFQRNDSKFAILLEYENPYSFFFSFFISSYFIFSPNNECPGLCQHRFHIPKVWQILKHFAGIFHRAQTLKLRRVFV